MNRQPRRTAFSLLVASITVVALQLPSPCADELQGHVQKMNEVPRIKRPPTPAVDPEVDQFKSKVSASILKTNIDEGNFELGTSAAAQHALSDVSHWNPWHTKISVYRAPIQVGRASDYAAVESRWPASVETRTINGVNETFVVSLAMCPMPEYRQAWERLMQELRADGGSGPWKRWQDEVCSRLADQQASIGALSVPWGEHVALHRNGAITFGAPFRPPQPIATPEADLEQSAIQSLALRLPPWTQVPELHFRVHIRPAPQAPPRFPWR